MYAWLLCQCWHFYNRPVPVSCRTPCENLPGSQPEPPKKKHISIPTTCRKKAAPKAWGHSIPELVFGARVTSTTFEPYARNQHRHRQTYSRAINRVAPFAPWIPKTNGIMVLFNTPHDCLLPTTNDSNHLAFGHNILDFLWSKLVFGRNLGGVGCQTMGLVVTFRQLYKLAWS